MVLVLTNSLSPCNKIRISNERKLQRPTHEDDRHIYPDKRAA